MATLSREENKQKKKKPKQKDRNKSFESKTTTCDKNIEPDEEFVNSLQEIDSMHEIDDVSSIVQTKCSYNVLKSTHKNTCNVDTKQSVCDENKIEINESSTKTAIILDGNEEKCDTNTGQNRHADTIKEIYQEETNNKTTTEVEKKLASKDLVKSYSHSEKTLSYEASNKVLYPDVSKEIRSLSVSSQLKSDSLIKPFTFEEIGQLFGSKELNAARTYSERFRSHEDEIYYKNHPLFEWLMTFKKAYQNLSQKVNTIEHMVFQTAAKEKQLWTVSVKTARQKGRCEDGRFVELKANYEVATFNTKDFAHFKMHLQSVRDEITSGYAMNMHNALFLRHQIEEMLCTITMNEDRLKEYLCIVFNVLRTLCFDVHSDYINILSDWCYALGFHLLKISRSLENILFILHNLLRQPRSVRWSYALIQFEVNSMPHVVTALCIMDGILTSRIAGMEHSNALAQSSNEPIKSNNSIEPDIWMVVESEGDGADADALMVDGTALSEGDLVALLRQIPLADVFKQLTMVREGFKQELLFCGAEAGGHSVLKSFCGIRLLLDICRSGLLTFPGYTSLGRELCRVVLQSVHYCSDLLEAVRCNCSGELVLRLTLEFDNIFRAAWLVLESCQQRDTSVEFLSQMPFSQVSLTMVKEFYTNMTASVKDTHGADWYRRLSCVAGMADSHRDEDFSFQVFKYIFQMVFLSEAVVQAEDDKYTELAKNLCGDVASKNYRNYSRILDHLAALHTTVKWSQGKYPHWLGYIQVKGWRPSEAELVALLQDWATRCPQLLSPLLQHMDWSPQSGISMVAQHRTAIFLAQYSRAISVSKKPIPEWICDRLFDLRLHLIEYRRDLNEACDIDQFQEVLFNMKCCEAPYIMVALLVTRWGHSVPEICENGLPQLMRLTEMWRFREVVHCLNYIMIVMMQSPESILYCDGFKNLLLSFLNAERCYSQRAARLLSANVASVIDLLRQLLKTHLTHTHLKLSPQARTTLLGCWLNFFVSYPNWSSDTTVCELIDLAIRCCHSDHEALRVADQIFRTCIEKAVQSKPDSPTAALLSFAVPWSAGVPFSGLLKCNAANLPDLALMVFQAEHRYLEKESGIWDALVIELSKQDGKINVDKALKGICGVDNSSGLVIYRLGYFLLIAPITHPVTLVLWIFFFTMFRDTPSEHPSDTPVGNRLYSGVFKSRQLASLVKRLNEVLEYQRACLAQEEDGEKEDEDMVLVNSPRGTTSVNMYIYHFAAVSLLKRYLSWLDAQKLPELERSKTNINEEDIFVIQFWAKKYSEQAANSVSPWPYPTEHPEAESDELDPSKALKTPAERILQRISSHPRPEKPTDSHFQLLPLIETSWRRADSGTLMNNLMNLVQELRKCASEFVEESRRLCSVDGKLCDALPARYVRMPFVRRQHLTCGESCSGGVTITINATESCLNVMMEDEAERIRGSARLARRRALAKRPTQARLAAKLAKATDEICADSLPLGSLGAALFERVLGSIDSTVSACPPVEDCLTTIASQLGQRFITCDGERCAALLASSGDAMSSTVVSAILQPARLAPPHRLQLYTAILQNVTRPHVAFSYLSKFDIPSWLQHPEASYEHRTKLIRTIVSALADHGSAPPDASVVLQELLCVHLSHVLSRSLASHLPWTLAELTAASTREQLPADVWTHLVNVVRNQRGYLPLSTIVEIESSCGKSWWDARVANAPFSALGSRSLYAAHVAQLALALVGASVMAANTQTPALSMEEKVSRVFYGAVSIYDAWLVPWWTSGQQGLPLRPWATGDSALAALLAYSFQDTLQVMLEGFPGGEIYLLRHCFRWHWKHFCERPHISLEDVYRLVRPLLLRLPWDKYTWMQIEHLEIATQMVWRERECRVFACRVLGGRPERWMDNVPPEAASYALSITFYCLVGLPFQPEVISEATTSLPWEQLDRYLFAQLLEQYMKNHHTLQEPCYTRQNFELVCAAATLNRHANVISLHESYRATCAEKRTCLVSRITAALGEILPNNFDKQDSASCNLVQEGTERLLDAIESACVGNRNVDNLVEDEDCIRCLEELLGSAILMLCLEPQYKLTLKCWLSWSAARPLVCVSALLRAVSSIVCEEPFIMLSQHTLLNYFKKGGKWPRVMQSWDVSCFGSLSSHVSRGCLMSGLASILTRSCQPLLTMEDIAVLEKIVPTQDMEEQLVLWMSFLLLQLYHHDTVYEESLRSSVRALLECWAQEPPWDLLKALRISADTAPTHRFRLVARFAVSVIIKKLTSVNPSTGSLEKSSRLALEAMMKNKPAHRDLIAECLLWLDDIKLQDNFVTCLHKLCCELYSDRRLFFDIENLSKLL